MFLWLKKILPQATRRVDSVFGTITYMDGYWEGAGVFPPTGESVEYFISSNESGPTPDTYENFKLICSDFDELHRNATLAIANAEEYGVQLNTVKVSSLDIPAGNFATASWEMNFTDSTGNLYSVMLKGHEPTGQVDVT